MSDQETVTVPLPFGLTAIYVMRPKPKPRTPPAAPYEPDDRPPWDVDDSCPF